MGDRHRHHLHSPISNLAMWNAKRRNNHYWPLVENESHEEMIPRVGIRHCHLLLRHLRPLLPATPTTTPMISMPMPMMMTMMMMESSTMISHSSSLFRSSLWMQLLSSSSSFEAPLASMFSSSTSSCIELASSYGCQCCQCYCCCCCCCRCCYRS